MINLIFNRKDNFFFLIIINNCIKTRGGNRPDPSQPFRQKIQSRRLEMIIDPSQFQNVAQEAMLWAKKFNFLET